MSTTTSSDSIPSPTRGVKKSKALCPVGTRFILNPRGDKSHDYILDHLRKVGVQVDEFTDVEATVTGVKRGAGCVREVELAHAGGTHTVPKLPAHYLLGSAGGVLWERAYGTSDVQTRTAAEDEEMNHRMVVEEYLIDAAHDIKLELEAKASKLRGKKLRPYFTVLRSLQERFPALSIFYTENTNHSTLEDQQTVATQTLEYMKLKAKCEKQRVSDSELTIFSKLNCYSEFEEGSELFWNYAMTWGV